MPRTNNIICAVCGKPFYKRPNTNIVCCSMECATINRFRVTIQSIKAKNNIEDLGDWLVENYENRKLSYREIAKSLSVNERTVKRLLTHHKIEIRYGSDAIKTQWYGEKRGKRVVPNVYNINGDIVEIVMHRNDGSVTGTSLIDAEDIDKAKEYHWGLNTEGYVVTTTTRKRTSLHRHLLNIDDDKLADHINGDRSDNRKRNLRECTRQQNTINRCIPKTNTSGVKGVSKRPNGRWQASITYNGETKYLGTYDKFEDAVKVRKEAEEYYFKEFRRI